MHVFYIPDIVAGGIYNLDKEESYHCVRVLRLRDRDEVMITDGKGGLYLAEIVQADIRCCSVLVKNPLEDTQKRSFRVHIALAPTKNISRTEWFIEKATEMGVDRISLFVSEHSERTSVNMERLNKLVISAAKQSVKAMMPQLDPLCSFESVIMQADCDKKFLACCNREDRTSIKKEYVAGESAMVMIGPEGDFSEKEVKAAEEMGFRIISLGQSRLRTETAALYALQNIHFVNS